MDLEDFNDDDDKNENWLKQEGLRGLKVSMLFQRINFGGLGQGLGKKVIVIYFQTFKLYKLSNFFFIFAAEKNIKSW